jgi:hypothetical protein
VFNEDYKAIKQVKFNMVYETDFKGPVLKTYKIAYKNRTESQIIKLLFKIV